MHSRCFGYIVTVFIIAVLNCSASAEEADAKAATQTFKSVKPRYRVLYNQDCTDLFDREGDISPRDVERMVDEVAGGGADVMLVNPNGQCVNYPSKVRQTFWDGYKEGDRSFFGDVPDDSVKRRSQWVGRMAKLAEQCDYMATALARCRKKGIAPGISLRMNDMHDVPWPNSHIFSRFYKQNPQLRLKPIAERSWGSEGLDYAHPEVREHYLALIRELAAGYDFDVLELDFMRFPYYFERENIEKHCKTMTGFIREVRRILAGTGRRIYLIPRVASSPEGARRLGFDVRAWAREGLVDGITTANFLCTCWILDIEAFRSAVGPQVAVYAGLEVASDRRNDLAVRYLPADRDMLRGFAAANLAAGADGIHTFNFFLARKHKPITPQQFYDGLRELRSLEDARGKPRIHPIDAGLWLPVCDKPNQLPATIRAGTERALEMMLAAETEGRKVEAHVYFDGENKAKDIKLKIGDHSVDGALEIREGPVRPKEKDANHKIKIAVFRVPPGAVKDGINRLILRSEKSDAEILGIDVIVR